MKTDRYTWSSIDLAGVDSSNMICTDCIHNKVKCMYYNKEPDDKKIIDIVVSGKCEHRKAAIRKENDA